MAAAERADLADLLDGLAPAQWDAPSLCTGWTVKEVAAHVISYEEHSSRDQPRRLRAVGWRPGRLNEAALAEYRHLTPSEIVGFLRDHLHPSGATARFGGRVGLTDAVIHHQDIRRPPGLHRRVPAERLQVALPFAVWAAPLRGFWRARGVRLVATDTDWAWGRGPEVRGPGDAVLMVMAGRGAALDDVTGPGVARLRQRGH